MIKRITLLVTICLILSSCRAVISTMLNVDVSDARRTAKILLKDNPVEINFEKNMISADFEKYLKSKEGQDYYQDIKLKHGELKSLKFKLMKGNSQDTMNYIFKGKFKNQPKEELEVRVQAFKDKEIIGVLVIDEIRYFF
ncbi:hypothetical protein [Nonlabens antarcticus]|uniref:hypothetical protein n=1 Tax=Nonlabens antarcticus TaxID=392714 RepID=UPI001891DE8F|nr:hypothetical protein [Nonlabens antarcticus]